MDTSRSSEPVQQKAFTVLGASIGVDADVRLVSGEAAPKHMPYEPALSCFRSSLVVRVQNSPSRHQLAIFTMPPEAKN